MNDSINKIHIILKNLKLKNSLVLCSVLLGNIFKIVCGLIKNVLESERERERQRERQTERERATTGLSLSLCPSLCRL